MAVNGIGPGPALAPLGPLTTPADAPGAAGGAGTSAGASFGEALLGALESARGAEQAATDAAERFAAGDPGTGIHETLIAAEKAQIGVRFAVTLKNKVIEAYRELMNTPV
jgi:flagellar hook-basal body complex protein FliE